MEFAKFTSGHDPKCSGCPACNAEAARLLGMDGPTCCAWLERTQRVLALAAAERWALRDTELDSPPDTELDPPPDAWGLDLPAPTETRHPTVATPDPATGLPPRRVEDRTGRWAMIPMGDIREHSLAARAASKALEQQLLDARSDRQRRDLAGQARRMRGLSADIWCRYDRAQKGEQRVASLGEQLETLEVELLASWCRRAPCLVPVWSWSRQSARSSSRVRLTRFSTAIAPGSRASRQRSRWRAPRRSSSSPSWGGAGPPGVGERGLTCNRAGRPPGRWERRLQPAGRPRGVRAWAHLFIGRRDVSHVAGWRQ